MAKITRDYPLKRPQSIVLRLPPFQYLCTPSRRLLARKSIVAAHLLVVGVLYVALLVVALDEKAIRISHGIGILQNPPFFVHVLCGLCSIPLILLLAKRVLAIPELRGENVIPLFLSLLRKNKTKNAIWSMAFILGLFSFSYTVSLSIFYKHHQINIYDSIAYPLTFTTYLIIRAYLYLVCYPFLFAAAPAITFLLFRSLNKSNVTYQPFHCDQMGGLRKYFQAVDRPIYALQSFAVLIALMNYVGWGGRMLVPLLLAIAAPIIVTLLAVFLFAHFRQVLTSKRDKEIQVICQQQMEFYLIVRNTASLDSKERLELLEKIEATERLLDLIKKSRQGGLGKYFVNVAVLIAPPLLKPIGEILVLKV